MTGLFIILILSYLAGSFPTSIVAGKLIGGVDIRQHGSGNPGVTNVLRVLGWKPALGVAVVDIFKGWFATVYLASLPVPRLVAIDEGVLQILAGFAAVLGHAYTVFARFRGGKGVATLAGMLVALYPVAVPPCFLVFALAVMTWGYVSVGSIAAAVTLPVVVLLLPKFGLQEPELSLKVFSLLIPLIVLYTHRSNIRRLMSGKENRFDRMMILRGSRKKS